MISNFWWTNFKNYIIMKHRVMTVAGWDQSGGLIDHEMKLLRRNYNGKKRWISRWYAWKYE
jgi:hypothetical protein